MPERYRQVLRLLPERLQRGMPALRADELGRVEEIRLRTGQAVSLTVSGAVRHTNGPAAEQQELEQVLQMAGKWSMHAMLDQLRGGYLTIEGGHRLGIAGTAVMEGVNVRVIRDISSLNLRVAREIKGCASKIALQLFGSGTICNTLIVSPPGGGKTTLLRDMIRHLSEQNIRVSVADERGELAAMWQGKAQMELGGCADVLTGCPKAQAVQMLLRGMNPQVIAVDEITAPEDVCAVEQAVGCGVAVLATAHACDVYDLHRRPIYQALLRANVFEKVVVLSREHAQRTIQIVEGSELNC